MAAADWESVMNTDEFSPKTKHSVEKNETKGYTTSSRHNDNPSGTISEDDTIHSPGKTKHKSMEKKFARRFFKGFCSGVGLYTGFKTVTCLMKNPFRESLPCIPQAIFSKDCMRFAAFLGLYPSMYELLVNLITRARGIKDGWNHMLAGCLAGLTIIVESPTRRRTLSLFTMARAIGGVTSTLITKDKIPSIQHGDTLLFCLSCAFLTYCVAIQPQLLPKGYYYSVLKWSRDYTDKILSNLFRIPGNRFITCQESGLHTNGCSKHAVKDFINSWPMFAKLYLPIHLAPVFIFRRHLLLKNLTKVTFSLGRNVVMSTAFVATMATLAKYVICLLRNAHGGPPPLPAYIPAMGGLAAGLGVLFERANRRKELVLFLLPHILYALFTWSQEKKLVPWIKYSSVGFFAISMASVMHTYEREPLSLTPLINGILRYFVGKQTDKNMRTVKVRAESEMN